MTDEELIARLRQAAQGLRSFYKVGAIELIPAGTMHEAADRIEALMAERDVARVEWRRTLDRANENYARAVKAEAERDAANALLRDVVEACDHFKLSGGAVCAARAHLGAKP